MHLPKSRKPAGVAERAFTYEVDREVTMAELLEVVREQLISFYLDRAA